MTRSTSSFAALCLIASAACAQPAAEKLPDGAKIVKLVAKPESVSFTTPLNYSQLLITAHLESGDTVDVTRIAKIELPAKLVSMSAAGLIRPVADGKGEIVVSLGGKSLHLPVFVSGTTEDTPVGFVRDVQPVLGKLGCNAGTCHGAQAGKNGFKLSLRGYDPIYDFRALTDDLEGRRFNRAAPERSLMLLKPAGAVPHAGGVVMQAGDPNYELLRRWIAQGVKLDLSTPRVKSIEIAPKNPTVSRIGSKQQFAVIATYTDGTVRDVSAESFIVSSNTDVATINKEGLLTSVRRGESTLLARYEGSYAASTVVVMGDRSGFAWSSPPQFNGIDVLVDEKLKRVRVLPSPICDDADFIRRVYLDLTGMPPSPEEVKAFLADKRELRIKREELIDKLVGSEPFIEQWTNKWADLLQVNRKFLGEAGAAAFQKWIRNAVAKNMPYDKFAFEILTASGSNVENPPAAYYKVLRTPTDVMENTTQLFLAVRFNCNKCHDHPFERWTQDNYFELSAFFSRVTLKEDPKFKGKKLEGTNVEGGKPLVEIVAEAKDGEIKHSRTGAVSPPKFPFGIKATIPAADSRRLQVAKWVTSPTNPYFARSYVNRIWSYLLGVGLIEPVDDIRAGNPATNPELLDRLTAEFVASGFNTQKLVKTICKSRTYQLSISTNKWNRDDDINYSHALARRLPAEVLYDSIHKVTGAISKLPGLPPGSRASQLPDSNVNLPGGFLELFGKPVRESACECERSGGMNLGPVLAMVNGPIVADAIRDPNNRIAKLIAGEKDDRKVVDEIYLAVLNRLPHPSEREAGAAALRGADQDYALQITAYQKKQTAFATYKATLDAKQKAWEDGLRAQKPTTWLPLVIEKATSKQGPGTNLKDGAGLAIQEDGSVLASGKTAAVDVYTVIGRADAKGSITAVRLEALTDPSLPKKGPGRAAGNGNFVLNEFTLTAHPADKPKDAGKPIKIASAKATFEQEGYPAANAIDRNPSTGWAISPNTGKDQAILFRFEKPLAVSSEGVLITAVLDQRYGNAHTIGKFRLTVTTDPAPKLRSSVSAAQMALLSTPLEKRTPEQKTQMRNQYLAQDAEYNRLSGEAAMAPPAEARVLGAQDLVWALINSPAFLFNH